MLDRFSGPAGRIGRAAADAAGWARREARTGTARVRREIRRTDRPAAPVYFGSRESLALGLALVVFAALGGGLLGLAGRAGHTLLGGSTLTSGSSTALPNTAVPPPRLVQSAAGRFVFPGGAPDLVWPTSGSAAVEVVGLGLMGHHGSMDQQVPIASMTKTMTAYVVLKDHPLGADDPGPTLTLTASEAAEYQKALDKDESAVAVRTGEELTERQALEAMMLASAGDMADILAMWDAGSVDAFLPKMNRQARALGMTRTDYTDPTGLAASTVSTLADQLKLAEAVQRMPALTSIVAQRSAWVPVAGEVHNYNEALGSDSIDGIKTGTTAAAGSCLLFSAHYRVAGRTVTILGVVRGMPGSTGTPWSALAAAKRLVKSAEQALGTASAVPAGQPVAKIVTGSTTRLLAPTKTVTVFGWAGLVYRVTVTGSVEAPRLDVDLVGTGADPGSTSGSNAAARSARTADEVSVALAPIPRPAASSGTSSGQ